MAKQLILGTVLGGNHSFPLERNRLDVDSLAGRAAARIHK